MKTYIVDSFTKEPFKGNPAGVCFPVESLSEKKMLQIAQEFGLSETAFVQPATTPGIYAIRYFSPKKEIPLCGHATLAAAKVLFEYAGHHELHFITGDNIDLFIQQRGKEIVMEFPVYDTLPAIAPPAMLQALGVSAVVNTVYSVKNQIMVIEIQDTESLASLQPDYTALLGSQTGINGVLVTALSHDAVYDYHYRYFWPWSGTNEDPVTGGVQTFLAKYWGEKLNKNKMKAFQASARTGYMFLELTGAKVLLISEAVIILEGSLLVMD